MPKIPKTPRRKTYSKSYKDEAVAKFNSSGESYAISGAKSGVSAGTLFAWVNDRSRRLVASSPTPIPTLESPEQPVHNVAQIGMITGSPSSPEEPVLKTLASEDDIEKSQSDGINKLTAEKQRIEKENNQVKSQNEDLQQKLLAVQRNLEEEKERACSDSRHLTNELSDLRQKIRDIESSAATREQKLRQENIELKLRLVQENSPTAVCNMLTLDYQLQALITAFLTEPDWQHQLDKIAEDYMTDELPDFVEPQSVWDQQLVCDSLTTSGFDFNQPSEEQQPSQLPDDHPDFIQPGGDDQILSELVLGFLTHPGWDQQLSQLILESLSDPGFDWTSEEDNFSDSAQALFNFLFNPNQQGWGQQ
jgi:transposase-like protein